LEQSRPTLTKHPDCLNTPRAVYDDQQQLRWRWDQVEPFGVNMPDENPASLGAFEMPLRFPGQYSDKETNLNYNYFRDYDPAIGRYAQSDPIGLGSGLNTYVYTMGNPTAQVDPDGLEVKWKGELRSGAVIPGIGAHGIYFEFESECKCNKIVTISGFAAFIAVGAGIKVPYVPKDTTGAIGHMNFSTIFECPSEDDANGVASVFGINIVPGGGSSFATRTKIGRLNSGFQWAHGPHFGLDLSASVGIGRSTKLQASTRKCCDKAGK